MKTIIAGSRTIDFETTIEYLSELRLLGVEITEVVSGTAKGVDYHGEWWGNRWDIPIKRFPANWNEYGKSAGYIRNQEMADYAEQLVCIWDGESKGTKHMIDIAKKKRIPIYLLETNEKQQLSLF
jgi:hypothetical protein